MLEHAHKHRHEQPLPVKEKAPKTRATKPLKSPVTALINASFSGFLAGGLALGAYLAIHASRASTPGGFFHYLATRGSHLKLMLVALSPAVVVALGLLAAIWLWLRAGTIYTTSRLYDHRPVDRKVAYKAGFNALGGLMTLAVIELVVAALWTAGLVGVIKGVGSLSLVYWETSAVGVAASFGLVLIGLWLLASLSLTAYLIVLSGQSLSKSLRQASQLVTRDYAYTAGTGLGLLFVATAVLLITIASFVGLNGSTLNLPIWLSALGGGIVAAVVYGLLANFSLRHWTKRYRQSTARVYGPDQTVLYLAGRHPKPISRTGISITIIWWLAIGIGGAILLWHLRLDPTGLFKKLAADIY